MKRILFAALLCAAGHVALGEDTDGDGLLDLVDVPGFNPTASGVVRHVGRQIEDLDGASLLTSADGLDVPVVLLAFDGRELRDFEARHDLEGVERVFLWQGDARVLLAIVKSIEDRRNVARDTASLGVQVILLVEDNVRYYSSFLPEIYSELLQHSQRVISEGANLAEKITRMRARPKILLCGSFD